jgi:hypothetical protein
MLRKLLEEGPVVKNSSDLQILMRDVYETTYGIWDHGQDSDEDLLSLVAHRAAEDTGPEVGLLYERIRQYDEREILKTFGLDLVQFLELPTDMVTYLLELGLRKQASKDNVARDVENEMKQMNLFD